MDRESIFQHVQDIIKDSDIFAATEFLFQLGDPESIVDAFGKLLLDIYHKNKSIDQAMHFGQAGINFALFQAVSVQKLNPSLAKELRFGAKKMATNIASFTWPGWDEPGIKLSPQHKKTGLIYAKFSIRLLLELEPSADQLSFSYWFLGAQLLANRNHQEAIGVTDFNCAT